MFTQPLSRDDLTPALISTGQLPDAERVQTLLDHAHALFRDHDEGQNSTVYPALERVPRDQFGCCIIGANGRQFTVGDVDTPFTLMSVSKPLVFALMCDQYGAERMRALIGVNATGLPFNSVMAVELDADRLTNPMVNSGAIATTSLTPGETLEAKWDFIRTGLSRFAGRELTLNEEVYTCAMETNLRNQGIARLLRSYDRLYDDPARAVDLYTRQCSLDVTAIDLAVMAATLANGGRNPLTGDQVVDARCCNRVLAVMTTAGMYETSGDWLWEVGLPSKSGIGGGIMTAIPGKGGLGTFSPPLDAAGNSVRGQLVARYLAYKLGLNLFLSSAASR